jgi:hypothetical protein
MPLFFLIAIGAGAITLGAIATDGKPFKGKQTAETIAFDVSVYASTSDCLTAASAEGAPLSACAKEK